MQAVDVNDGDQHTELETQVSDVSIKLTDAERPSATEAETANVPTSEGKWTSDFDCYHFVVAVGCAIAGASYNAEATAITVGCDTVDDFMLQPQGCEVTSGDHIKASQQESCLEEHGSPSDRSCTSYCRDEYR